MLTEEHKQKMREGRKKAAIRRREEKLKQGLNTEPTRPNLSEDKVEETFKQKVLDKTPVSCCAIDSNWCWLDINEPREAAAIEEGYTEVCQVCLTLK